jgi:hypothetical protein
VTPIVFLISCLILSGAAFAIDFAGDARRRATLRRLADEREMHFAAGDRFNLARRVWAAFPVVGAASPKVADVLYGRRDDRYHYVFRFDYTIGGTSRPRRCRAIVAFSEPRDRAAAGPANAESMKLHIADGDLPLSEQYRRAIESVGYISEPTPKSPPETPVPAAAVGVSQIVE